MDCGEHHREVDDHRMLWSFSGVCDDVLSCQRKAGGRCQWWPQNYRCCGTRCSYQWRVGRLGLGPGCQPCLGKPKLSTQGVAGRTRHAVSAHVLSEATHEHKVQPWHGMYDAVRPGLKENLTTTDCESTSENLRLRNCVALHQVFPPQTLQRLSCRVTNTQARTV